MEGCLMAPLSALRQAIIAKWQDSVHHGEVGRVGGVRIVEENILEAASTILFVISATWASTVFGDSRVEDQFVRQTSSIPQCQFSTGALAWNLSA
jgi:hypothetical protein